MFPRAARVFVAAELLFGIAYFLLPPSGLRAIAYNATSLGMVVAVGIRVSQLATMRTPAARAAKRLHVMLIDSSER